MAVTDISLSVIVPCSGNMPALKRLLASLNHQTLESRFFEVVAVDCSQGTALDHFFKYSAFVINAGLVDCKGEGTTAARNSGVAQCEGDRVLFLSEDMVAPPTLLEAHLTTLKENQQTIVSGPVYPIDPQVSGDEVPELDEDTTVPPLFFDLRNTSMPKMALVKIEGLSEEVSQDFENINVLWQLRMENYAEKFVPLAYCYQDSTYCSGRTIEAIEDNARLMARSAVSFLRRHPSTTARRAVGISAVTPWKNLFTLNPIVTAICKSLSDPDNEKMGYLQRQALQTVFLSMYYRYLSEEFRAYHM